MLRKINWFLLLAVLFGLAAAWGVYAYLQAVKESYRAAGDFRPVVVAREKIPPQTRITENMVEVKEVPAAYVHKEALSRKEEAVGRVSTAPIFPGEQVLKGRVAAGDAAQGLAFQIGGGKRAATIAVDEVSGVGGHLRPGDRVDVVGTVDVPQGGAKVTVTTLLLQNVAVLAVDRSVEAGGNRGAGARAPQAQTVTLEVTPQQAQVLILAAERGSVRLLLRPAGEEGELSLPSARLEHLVR
ncbi:Flp pilus assembly protein CpaB [Desulfovirgula thermocuniculi]|uniref:Flp pilus assembly protein CpaB n=1 Tax=Desulfovirgula thermocuniculi TaxID=348842 RepID=UPI0003F70212|nr:Flp pilus assembly protein CpaB [Desulfovirgula thermocuniculi]